MVRLWKRSRIYLDIAAGGSGNPSSPHAEGRTSRDMLEGARTVIARVVECKPDNVIFTSGATEANALAILGVARAAREARGGAPRPHILYLPSAHASIIENVQMAGREGARIEPLSLRGTQVDCGVLVRMLRPETVLITMEAVCGETGVVWNTREVSHALRAHGQTRFGQPLSKPGLANDGPWLHVDASQAAWTEKLQRAHFGADLMTLDSSKVCETRSAGCLLAPRAVPLAPLYGGGGQERGLRPGSEAPALAAAFAAGLAHAAAGRERFRKRAEALRARLLARLSAAIPDLLVNEGPPESGQAPHIVNVSLPGRDTDYLVALLDEAGCAVSTVSACESASGEPSRAVLALFGDPARAAATLRISWGPPAFGASALWRIDRFVETLVHAVRFVDSAGTK